MRGITITAESELVTETCCNCGILFAMTTSFQKRRQQDHGGFYCPAGHIQYYLAEHMRKQHPGFVAEEIA